jgi:hypothetical protein
MKKPTYQYPPFLEIPKPPRHFRLTAAQIMLCFLAGSAWGCFIALYYFLEGGVK